MMAAAKANVLFGMTPPPVITGLVPVSPIGVAMPCLLYRDGRDNPRRLKRLARP
jgi:hypothetical protein